MSCSVNLVPESRLVARRRIQRAWRWALLTGLTLGVFALGLGTRIIAARALEQHTRALADRRTERAEVLQRLTAASDERAAIVRRLKTLAAARHAQPWPGRLVALAEAAPDGIFLTTIEIATPADRKTPSQRPTESRRSKKIGQPPPPEPPAPPANAEQVVHLRGYALDHAALLQLVNTLQDLPGWSQVELKRGTLGPLGGHMVVEFEIDCRAAEEA